MSVVVGLVVVALVSMFSGCRKDDASPLIISSAASFQDVIAELSQTFGQTQPDLNIVHNSASSSALARQVLAGAPCDVMISADLHQMQRLADATLVVHRQPIATGKLVVVARSSHVGTYATFADLVAGTQGPIAIGDSSVPVGEYAREYLNRLGVDDAVRARLIPHRNARHVLATVRAGNAVFGFVYATDVLANEDVRTVLEPAEGEASTVVYPAAVLTTGKNRKAGSAFVNWLGSNEARAIIRKHGFGAPGREDSER